VSDQNTPETSAADPGWYPDPSQAGHNRFWDGSHWTERVVPTAPAPTGLPLPIGNVDLQPPKHAHHRASRPRVLVLSLAIAAVTLIGLGAFVAIINLKSHDAVATSATSDPVALEYLSVAKSIQIDRAAVIAGKAGNGESCDAFTSNTSLQQDISKLSSLQPIPGVAGDLRGKIVEGVREGKAKCEVALAQFKVLAGQLGDPNVDMKAYADQADVMGGNMSSADLALKTSLGTQVDQLVATLGQGALPSTGLTDASSPTQQALQISSIEDLQNAVIQSGIPCVKETSIYDENTSRAILVCRSSAGSFVLHFFTDPTYLNNTYVENLGKPGQLIGPNWLIVADPSVSSELENLRTLIGGRMT